MTEVLPLVSVFWLPAFVQPETGHIDAVVEQNAEASLNFENAQTGLSGNSATPGACVRSASSRSFARSSFWRSIGLKWQERQLASFAMFIQHQTEHDQTLPPATIASTALFMTEAAVHAHQRVTQGLSR